ncbi:hypothetical protein G9P44_002556 [Scheffersomyces stipitis]|nr:hypothetical protein G9P44_002556 [Scheffersomyces stipitis]
MASSGTVDEPAGSSRRPEPAPVQASSSISASNSSERKLRSNDHLKKEPNQLLFNFENLSRLLYRNDPISVSSETDYGKLFVSGADPGLPLPSAISKKSDVQIRSELLPRSKKNIADPLPDKCYDVFHRKMKKEEKVMTNEDRLRILSEVDNLQTQLALLNQYDWIRHLPGIAFINDPRDYEELEQKKLLTISEIERLIRKHENWRRRLDAITAAIKEFEIYGDDEKETDEYDVPIDVLKERRQAERRRLYGPRIKLRLNNLYSLIIDPILPPKIVHTSELIKNGKSKSGIRKDITPISNGASNGLHKPERTYKLPVRQQPSKSHPKAPVKQKLSRSVKHNSLDKSLETVSPVSKTMEISSPHFKRIARRGNSDYRLEDITTEHLDFQINGTDEIAFGTHIGIEVSTREFQLPRALKRTADRTLKEREAFNSELHDNSN